MSAPISHSNLSNDIAIKYLKVNDLKKSNFSTPVITFNYNSLDTITQGKLKDAIAAKINCFLKEYELSEDLIKILKLIFKSNSSNICTIEYEKIKKLDENIEDSLRQTVQTILNKRASELYFNMMQNPTV